MSGASPPLRKVPWPPTLTDIPASSPLGITDTAVVEKGRNFISCSRDGTAKLWDSGSQTCLGTFDECGGIVNGCSIGIPTSGFHLGAPDQPTSKYFLSEGDIFLRPDFYDYLFLEPSSQENYKMKIKIYFGAFPVPSSQKIHKNEIKLKFYFYFFPALHHKYFRCQVYFF
jgi:WD40 repeat protein